MSENIEEKLAEIKDAESPEGKDSRIGLELARSEEADDLVAKVDEIAQALEKDEPVVQGDVKRLEEALQNVKVDFGGEGVTLAELKRDSDMKSNLKIWHEIRDSKSNREANENVGELTRITPKILDIVTNYESHQLDWQILSLRSLKFLSDECAELLREKKFIGLISLDSLTSISNDAMEAITANGRNSMNLNSLVHLSDRSALALSRLRSQTHEIDPGASLRGLKSVSEQGLKFLAKMKRGILQLPSEIESKVEVHRSKWSKLGKWLDKQLEKSSRKK